MEEERAFTTTVPNILDHHHFQLSSFSNPINEMGSVHYFETHHNQALNFLASKNPSFGSNNDHNHEPAGTRVPWNEVVLEHHSQVESVLPNKAAELNDESCNGDEANEAGHSWLSHTPSYSDNKSKMKIKRKLREPRFCFQTRSDVDVLDDGYKWRKYGQKIVKNSLHPRSYFRCTHSNCRVKKRVERLSEDCRMVITMYEGRHNHSPSEDSNSSSEREFFTSL